LGDDYSVGAFALTVFFSSVEPSLGSTHWTGFDRLAIDESRARFFFSAHLGSHLFAQRGQGLLPGAVEFPAPEIVVHRFAVGQVVGHLSPRAARSQEVQDAIHDFSSRNWLAR
jgi:hypothetical protein